MSIPFLDDNKNWLLPGMLCVGGCPRSSLDISLLLDKGVKMFVNLMTASKEKRFNTKSLVSSSDGVVYHHLPIPDEGVVDDSQQTQLAECIATHILNYFTNGTATCEVGAVYIYCRGGLGRSMMMGIAVMIKLFDVVGSDRLYEMLDLDLNRSLSHYINSLINFSDRQKRKRKIKSKSSILTSSLQRNYLARIVGEKVIYFYNEKKQFGHFSNFFAGNKRFPLTLRLPFNYSNFELGDEGVSTFDTTEHFYQIQKFLYPGMPEANLQYARLMMFANTPNKVANMGRLVARGQYAAAWYIAPEETLPSSLRGQGYGEPGGYIKAVKDAIKNGVVMRDDWDDIKDEIMMFALEAKFNKKTNPKLYNVLTDVVRDGYSLREYTPRDDYWAVFAGSGKGMLGILLGRLGEQLLTSDD